MTCDRCGADYGIAAWPFCPHGTPNWAARSDSIPGGMIIENLGPTPMRFDSWSDYHREVDRRGLVNKVQHVPVPGTDKSPYTTSWATMDAVTLENARVLAERQASTKATNDPGIEPMQLHIEVSDHRTGVVEYTKTVQV